MDFKDLKKILEQMVDADLRELEIEDKGFRLAAKRGPAGETQYVMAPQAGVAPAAASVSAPASFTGGAQENSGAAPAAGEDDGFDEIISPVVGTFYRSPSPEADSFVKVGDQVDTDTVVCIIEAMKVMNEIKAERKGIIRKILVENGDPLEYGQALFKIESN